MVIVRAGWRRGSRSRWSPPQDGTRWDRKHQPRWPMFSAAPEPMIGPSGALGAAIGSGGSRDTKGQTQDAIHLQPPSGATPPGHPCLAEPVLGSWRRAAASPRRAQCQLRRLPYERHLCTEPRRCRNCDRVHCDRGGRQVPLVQRQRGGDLQLGRRHLQSRVVPDAIALPHNLHADDAGIGGRVCRLFGRCLADVLWL